MSTQIPGFIADTGDAAPLGANEVQNIHQSTSEIYVSAQCKKQMDVQSSTMSSGAVELLFTLSHVA